jgi:probable addiction module antidote protein
MSEKFPKLPIGPQSSSREIADYIIHAFETSDIGGICEAVGAVIHLHNVSDIAKKAGIERPSVYRAFSGKKKFPNFNTVLNVLDAMDFQLQVRVRRGGRAKRARLAQFRVVGNLTSDLETKINFENMD